MATTPRIPQHLVEGFFMQVEYDGSPASAIAIPVELSRLAGIPVQTKRSLKLDPVLHELIRLYNAKYQDCQYCQNARQTIAVQNGLEESMVDSLADFDNSSLPDNIKAGLQITKHLSQSPGLMTDEIWAAAEQHFTPQEMIDLVILSMATTGSKVTITLGLDPGAEASSRQFYPTEDVYGESADLKEAVEELRQRGFSVDAPEGVTT